MVSDGEKRVAWAKISRHDESDSPSAAQAGGPSGVSVL